MNCTRKFRCDGVMYMIKVLLADDQELIRESLGFVLGAQGDITVVGMAKNGREAIELVRSEKPDVVLMDIRMPEVDGVECTRLIKSAHPNIKVIVLTTFDDDEYVFNALRFGGKTPCAADGLCHNCLSPDCICNQILITRNCNPPGRIKFILVGEDLGL